MFDRIQRADFKFPTTEEAAQVSPQAKDLIKRLLEVDPVRRLSMR